MAGSFSPVRSQEATKTHCITHRHTLCPPLNTDTQAHTHMHSTHSHFNMKGLTPSTVAIKTRSDYAPQRCRDLKWLTVHRRLGASVPILLNNYPQCVLQECMWACERSADYGFPPEEDNASGGDRDLK